MKLGWLVVAGSLAFAPACVKSSTHRAKVGALQKQLSESEAREQALKAKLAKTEQELAALTTERTDLQKQLEVGGAMNAAMEERLKSLGQNVESLHKERAIAQARLEELRRQKALADERAATFRNLVAKLRQMIDSGQLKVIIRDGRMIIALPNDILFDSGSTSVKKAGTEALAKVAQVLTTVSDRRFLVVGHTDNVPIKTAQFASNWELSTARAVGVVQFLISKGMNPKVVSAAGYSEFDPVVPNDTVEHKAQNRRIEIVLQPNLADLPPLDDVGK
ncbi:MAG: OmpA family protein [Myxococcota bacterium]|nr:OmpA family protein [Myxococcota bacterium]